MNNKKIIYLTYQTFPANTANSLQTISNIKYLLRNNIEVELYFPLRERHSSSNLQLLQEKYHFDENFKIYGLTHNYLHGKLLFFKSFWYNFSHYFWSKSTVKKFFNHNTTDLFFTRSDWIAYFLAMQGSNVTFEVHQVSKVRNFVIKRIRKLSNVKFIFLNKELCSFYAQPKQSLVLHNGVDSTLFSKVNNTKIKNQIIYLGRLSRFDKPRGINQIIDWFSDSEINTKFTLKIVGGSKNEVSELNKRIQNLNLSDVISVYGWVNREEAINHLEKSSYGLLINSNLNDHSKIYTSPLKYFEYLYSKLKIIAIDFPSHRSLPFSNNISYFNDGDKTSFIKALKALEEKNLLNNIELQSITLDNRAKKIIEFIC